MDRPEQARAYYARFPGRHDLPVPALQPNVERARAGLARSSPSPPPWGRSRDRGDGARCRSPNRRNGSIIAPDPELAPEVEQIRQELSALLDG
jgi:hypothetical protein